MCGLSSLSSLLAVAALLLLPVLVLGSASVAVSASAVPREFPGPANAAPLRAHRHPTQQDTFVAGVGAERVWDLSGARVQPPIVAEDSDAEEAAPLTIQWSGPPGAALPGAPPLRFTLFALVSEHGERRSIRLCQVRGDTQCVVPEERLGRLPRQVPVALQLLTECDMKLVVAALAEGEEVPQCLSATSDPVHFVLPPSSRDEARMLEAGSSVDSGVAPLGDVAPEVRTALCQMNRLVLASSSRAQAWCVDGMPVCGNDTASAWSGVVCDSTNTSVVQLLLGSSNIQNAFTLLGIDLTPQLRTMPTLEVLDFSNNPALYIKGLNLSTLGNLQELRLGQPYLVDPVTKPQWMQLPPAPSALRVLDVSSTNYAVSGLADQTGLEELHIAQNSQSFQLADIMRASSLRIFDAQGSQLSSEAPFGGLSHGDLIHTWLRDLYLTHPYIVRVDLRACQQLSFASRLFLGWPVLNSPTLESFSLTETAAVLDSAPKADWLAHTPALRELNVYCLPNMIFRTDAFRAASANLSVVALSPPQYVQGNCATLLLGDLEDLCHLRGMTTLLLTNSGIQTRLPQNISACWPSLEHFTCQASWLHGPLPSFTGLPNLTELSLSQNELSGPLHPRFAADSHKLITLDLSLNGLSGPLPKLDTGFPALQFLLLSGNQLSGAVPSWTLPGIVTLSLAQNNFNGPLPATFWDGIANYHLQTLDLSSNSLSGSIPNPYPISLSSAINLGNNSFSGPYPANLTASSINLSRNNLSGPLVLLPQSIGWGVIFLNLEHAGQFDCEIFLTPDNENSLTTLSLRGAVQPGCDLLDYMQVQLPQTGLHWLDVSDNDWQPWMITTFFMGLPVLWAENANVLGLTDARLIHAMSLPLLELHLSGNSMSPSLRGLTQLDQWGRLLDMSANLRRLSCNKCNLQFDFQTFCDMIHKDIPSNNGQLMTLLLAGNKLTGSVPYTLFDFDAPDLPWSLMVLDISMNNLLTGALGAAANTFGSTLTSLNFTGISLSGSLPESYQALAALRSLSLLGLSAFTCPMVVSVEGEVSCPLPSWVRVSSTLSDVGMDGAAFAGFRCPSLQADAAGVVSDIELEEWYHDYRFCPCNDGWWGTGGQCFQCPSQCQCSGARIVGCFPVISQGLLFVEPGAVNPQGDRLLRPTISIMEFSVATFLQCDRSLGGQSLCNPAGSEWRAFYRVLDQLPSHSDTYLSQFLDPLHVNWTAFCTEGHEGRLCSHCTAGFYSSGRSCMRCLGSGLHVLIFLANLFVLLVLIAYIYVKIPGVEQSRAGLREYDSLATDKPDQQAKAQAAEEQAEHSGRELKHAAMEPALLSATEPMLAAQSPLSDTPAVAVPVQGPGAGGHSLASAPAVAANPLKLLVFFCQQLSLLLRTTSTIPSFLATLFRLVSSGGDSFSLTSLLAMECLSSDKTIGWTLSVRCWIALLAPLFVGAVALVVWLIDCRRSPARSGFGRAAAVDVAQNRISRLYGTCVSLLYFMVFPCAAMSLSGLTCTDTRELEPSSSTVEEVVSLWPARRYLNLYPWQQCDEAWRSSVLLPATLGTILWFVVFPALSTLLLRRLRRQLSLRSGAPRHPHAALVWPLCSDLLRPYSRRFWYWEQVLLLRRLALVACVCILPPDSMFLPVCLFSIIQLSTLLQHWAKPYLHPLLNWAELASLYILLLNYISALVLQLVVVNSPAGLSHSANVWAAFLFLLNFLFLLVLLAALLRFVRGVAANTWQRVQLYMEQQRGAKTGETGQHTGSDGYKAFSDGGEEDGDGGFSSSAAPDSERSTVPPADFASSQQHSVQLRPFQLATGGSTGAITSPTEPLLNSRGSE